jgi:hypothetical protein
MQKRRGVFFAEKRAMAFFKGTGLILDAVLVSDHLSLSNAQTFGSS